MTGPWRLFVAVLPTPAAVADLGRAVDRARDVLPRVSDGPGDVGRAADGVRWTDAGRWHLTLVFLGDLDPHRLESLRESFASVAAESHRMPWWLAGSGQFPARGRPHVLYVGVDGDVAGLERLARGCRRAAVTSGVRMERRPYLPHVTVARLRARGPARVQPAWVRPALAALSDYRGPLQTAEEVVLVRSHLGPQPRYEHLARWALPPAE